MTTQDPFFPTAAPDFSDPIGLLRACHERIFQHCDTLERLATHLSRQGADQAFQEAAAKIDRYFSTAAKHHHDDEEQDLFPRLARQSLKLADAVHHLQQEHEQLDALWREIEPMLIRPAAIDDPEAFAARVKRFANTYRAHAAKENEDLFAIAQHSLSHEELREMGRSMAERRGVALPATY
ncbi:MAG: hemerythrin domain-containing protein [Gammaproteobacteria bacterium]|nr:hemerythrin domain-containing protein [Gammaproteobacteria bacterium]MCW8993345.1 hemerythrin domain-containing protein [Gammaproteobacteria bacterium]MCW9088629.1 hemerythrin domain-containing protein [Gammaproteobacteria bacterium]